MKKRLPDYFHSHPKTLKTVQWAKNHKVLVIVIGFVVWMTFFDKNSLTLHVEREQNISDLQDSISYYKREIQRQRNYLLELQSDPKSMERFVRERYNMKKENEDIFVIKQESN